MSRHIAATCALALGLSALPTEAAPRHDLCQDVGDSFAFGVSSYGALRQWASEAKSQYGADFRFLYVYILAGGMDDPDNFAEWYVTPFVQTAKDMGAVPVLTFYQLLDLGKAAGYAGSEAEIVKSALASPTVMSTYFAHFVWLLDLAADLGPPIVVHSEPDSWGFMMWAMGVEGNDDPTSIDVKVTASGYPEVAGFADNAAGFGQALVALRESHAPEVRLGWHASNFRAGTHPEVVASFYAQVGDWDVLVGEHPHVEAEGASWWDPWDEQRMQVNLDWLDTVTAAAGLPWIFWQEPIGVDYHLIDDPSDLATLQRFVDRGAVAFAFEQIAHAGEDDPDDIRASGMFGEVPPPGHPAGGTAADMRARVAAYSQSPLSWPAGSICDTGVTTGEPETTPEGLGGHAPTEGDADAGCGCRLEAHRDDERGWLAGLLGAVFLMLRRRARSSRPSARCSPGLTAPGLRRSRP